MATDAASNVNGVYDNQYSQPAELAASTPSHVTSSSQNLTATNAQQKPDPQEVGWYFVEQYYTTLSKTPERIHLFYSKKSQLVTGVEAEKVVPAVGTKAISEKIKALDIQDCKVRVLNVDSQSSFDNIVVQVIGEMSNKSQPHHKFVQTFVLATQPNGYFVLNDIFRYLNEEEDEIIDDQPEQSEVAPEPAAQVEDAVEAPVADETVNTEAAANAVNAKLENISQPTAVENSKQAPADITEAEPTLPEKIDLPPQQASLIPAAEQPPAPEPTPVAEAPPKTTPEQSAVPAAKKTWANMVGTKAPAVPALPPAAAAVAIPSQPKPQKPAQSNPAQSPAINDPTSTAPNASETPANRPDEWQTADHSKKTKGAQVKGPEGVVHAYIRNITEKIEANELRSTLSKYGELKYFDISRPRNSAFVEFADPAGFAAAVAANPHEVNGETINVEERRPRPGQFNNNQGGFSRGGNNAGRGRGAFQGRGGAPANVPRDKVANFQQRGGKSGNVTPRGRGQPQPS